LSPPIKQKIFVNYIFLKPDDLKQYFIILLLFPFFVTSQCLQGDCQEGEGQYKLKNGIYTGHFSKGDISGEGEFVTRKGYAYLGNWTKGTKEGFGKESFRKGPSYEGNFSNNQRNGYGQGSLINTKFMQDIYYDGQWSHGSICGQGSLTYVREVKYGRNKALEKNTLSGEFVNGVFQGRLTTPYLDELAWEPFSLKMSDFQKYQTLTEKARKKLKHPATIEGDFRVSCECLGEMLIFDTKAFFRKELSWWSTKDVPTKTKPIVLNTMQREFDIIEWHARALQQKLNKQKLPCTQASIETAWEQISIVQKECAQVRKTYSIETAWNPKKGLIKNMKTQEKWNSKISKKLQNYEKANKKILTKINKKLSKENNTFCMVVDVDISICPTIPKPEVVEKVIEEAKKEKPPSYLSQIVNDWKEGQVIQAERAKLPKEEKKPSAPKSFKPQFPRSQQLE